MEFYRTVMMGDPAQFSIRYGANPHTRDRWGVKKKVNLKKAVEQWHALARTLTSFGVEVLVIPPDAFLPGLVFPANGGLILESEKPMALSRREYLLSTLTVSRAKEQRVYAEFLKNLGVRTHLIHAPFEGEADLIPWRKNFIFTYGIIKKQRWSPHWGIPPWKKIFGFRSHLTAAKELSAWIPWENVLETELAQEAFYHGDTVLASFGPQREFLMVYKEGLKKQGRETLEKNPKVLWLSRSDADKFAANSFQVIQGDRCVLFMPKGITRELQKEIEKKGIETLLIDVSEFFEKGGGSVKCLIGDLGVWAPESGVSREIARFREERWYPNLYK